MGAVEPAARGKEVCAHDSDERVLQDVPRGHPGVSKDASRYASIDAEHSAEWDKLQASVNAGIAVDGNTVYLLLRPLEKQGLLTSE